MSLTHIKRLTAGDTELARSLFSVMVSVLAESSISVSAEYTANLLNRDDVWIIAALVDGQPIAGLTAFVLPRTHTEMAELFIYDIAVAPAHQRQGIGRRLVEMIRGLAAGRGIATTWVAAENADVHALKFYKSLGGIPSPVTVFTFPK